MAIYIYTLGTCFFKEINIIAYCIYVSVYILDQCLCVPTVSTHLTSIKSLIRLKLIAREGPPNLYSSLLDASLLLTKNKKGLCVCVWRVGVGGVHVFAVSL